MRELDTPASDSYNQRFGGTRRLYGNSEVDILRAAHVCVIGIGGVVHGRSKRWPVLGSVS